MGLETIHALLLNYKQFPVSRIERAYFKDLDLALRDFKNVEGIEGAAIIQTCNRVEVYLETYNSQSLGKLVERWEDLTGDHEIGANVEKLSGEAVAKHLFRLSSGLESMVIGEQEILRQVKDAYFKALSNNSLSPVLKDLFECAIRVGKRVREGTKIASKRLSMAHVAVEAAERILRDLNDKTILIVGAGEMGVLVNSVLRKKPYRKLTVMLANRTYEKAVELANLSGGIALHLNEMYRYLDAADVIFMTTNAPHYLIKRSRVEGILRNRGRPLIIIELSVPRNVDPEVGSLPNVKLISVDELKVYVDEMLRDRLSEMERVEEMVERYLEDFIKKMKSKWVSDLISEIYGYADKVRREELEEALTLLGKRAEDERVKTVMDGMSRALMKRLLHPLVENLRKNCECLDKETITRILGTPRLEKNST